MKSFTKFVDLIILYTNFCLYSGQRTGKSTVPDTREKCIIDFKIIMIYTHNGLILKHNLIGKVTCSRYIDTFDQVQAEGLVWRGGGRG